MKLLIIGGHMAPALGFLSVLPKSVEAVYIGRKNTFEGDHGISLEYEIVTKKGIRFLPLKTGRIQRALTSHSLRSILKVPGGLFTSYTLLKKEKPDAVIGFGGYLSFPLGIAAVLLKIPLIIHESTLDAGLTNKILAPFAKKICISWDSSISYFPKNKTVLTGNPLLPFHISHIPQDFLPESKEKLPLVLIVGGSGGSHVINTSVEKILPMLLSFTRVIHQTGDAKEFNDYDRLISSKQGLPKQLQARYSVVKFVDPDVINSLYAKANLVVARSGINTVCSLLVLKKKSILIPLIVGQKNEQQKNAELAASEGYATILYQKSLSEAVFLAAIKNALTKNNTARVSFEIPIATNGAERMVHEVLQCLNQKES